MKRTIKTFVKRGWVGHSQMSRNKREGYYLFKNKGRFVRGASRIDSLSKFRTAGG